MRDAVRNYLAVASGLTEVTRQRAVAAAKALASSGEATAEQVTGLADDLLSTSRSNRDAMLALVRFEVDRGLSRAGLATAEDVATVKGRIALLESTVRQGRGDTGPPRKPEAKKAVTKKTAAKKAVTKKAVTKKAAAKGTAAKKTAAKKTAAKKTAAKKTTARSTRSSST